ncbi:MAG: DUF4230 domain-containing protein [Bacteroidetes bacterium]|jgi:hypothetical protein|nr:DUF4230 domain-containing protein [Bacteroidota bacterium]
MKYIVALIVIVILFAGGYFFSEYLHNKAAEKTHISNEVVLNQIKEVAKLVSVEGYFTEIYKYKNYYNMDWSIFTKKALVRVKAKASMGIDLNKMKLVFDEKSKTLTIGALPPVELISLDHTLDYYDISEGTFNSFSAEDYNKINNDVKEHIRNVALQSDLVQRAEVQSAKTLKIIQVMAETAGWKVVNENPEAIKG